MDVQRRNELLEAEGYTLNKWGLIAEPGKFEGEPWWSLEVNNWVLDGDGEIISTGDDPAGYVNILTITEEDRKAFGLDEEVKYISLHQSNEGFITCSDHTEEEKLAYVRDVMRENDGG